MKTGSLVTPLFGAKILLPLALAEIALFYFGELLSHTHELPVICIVLFLLMTFGMIAQVTSIRSRRTLPHRQQTLWWIASGIYAVWIAFMLSGLLIR
jgi:hypothetical protein